MVKEEIQNIVAEAVQSAGYKLNGKSIVIEYTDPQFGDFASNIAMQLAGSEKQPPRDIAESIIKHISHQLISSVEVAGPGFINITCSSEYWMRQLKEIKPKYSQNTSGKNKKVQVEFLSANPTGPTTIGNARGAFVGDVVARVLMANGFDVVREYYFNDAGTQVTKLLESVKAEAGLVDPEDRQYRGEYIAALAEKFSLELREKPDHELRRLITQEIIDTYIKPAIDKMGIEYDVWTNERKLIEEGLLDRALELLREKGLVFEKEGAVWLDAAQLGEKREERVLIKSNGDPTYLASDIAYHIDIFSNRSFDVAIKVLGADHIDQFPSVRSVVGALFPEVELEAVVHQWFRLVKDGKEVKISKRKGQFVTVSELIDEVGVEVARFFTLMRSNNSHIDFDLDLAKETSQKNPYYYVMYAYTRASSVLKKAKTEGLVEADEISGLNIDERLMVRKMMQLPELVAELVVSYDVHKLTFYARELAQMFHDYYEKYHVLSMEEAEARQKLLFIRKFRTGLHDAFSLLGIEPLERM